MVQIFRHSAVQANAHEPWYTDGVVIMSRSTSKPPLWEAVVKDAVKTITDKWRGWFIEVDEVINGMAGAVPADLTVSGSPFTYINGTKSAVTLLVNGGSVSSIQYSRNGVTFYNVPSAVVSVFPGDQVRVTYSATPTITVVPR